MILAAISFGQEEAAVTAFIEKLNSNSAATEESLSYDSTNYGEAAVKANSYIAITPYDFVTHNEAPYEYLKSSKMQQYGENFYKFVFLTFAVRYAYFNMKCGLELTNDERMKSAGSRNAQTAMSNQYVDNIPHMFATIEANNFKMSNPEKTKEIEVLLDKKQDDFKNFITSPNDLGLDSPWLGPVFGENDKGSYDYTLRNDQLFPISVSDPTE